MLQRYLDAEIIIDVQETYMFDVPKMLSEFKARAGTIEIADQDDYHHFFQIYEGETDFCWYSGDTLYLVIDGEIELEFKGHDPIAMGKFDCLSIPRGVVYKVKAPNRSTVLRFQSQLINVEKV